MADLPNSTVSVVASGALALTGDAHVVFFTAGQGDIATPKIYGSAQALLTEFGDCAGVDYMAAFIRKTRKPVVAVRMTTVTAGSIANLDTTGVTGLCVITAASHGNGIHDEVDFVFKVVTGGTVGAAGIEYKYSLDGGKNYSGVKALGTSTTIDITRIGVRLSLTTATLVAGDTVTFYTVPSKYDSTGITAAFTALKAHTTLFRGGIVIGEVTATDAANWQTALADYESFGRPMWLTMSARDRYHDAKMQGAPADVDFDGTAHTITRGTGSWVTDGFKVGMRVTVAGSASNDAVLGKLTAVTATVLTFAAGLTTEANVDGADLTITAEELEADWVNQLPTDFAAVLYDAPQISIFAGRGFLFSDVLGSDFGAKLRRPDAWADAIREFQYGMQIMTSKVENGALLGGEFTILDDDGNTVEHDERLNPGFTQAGFGSVRSFDLKTGVYTTLPLMRATNPNSGLSRRPVRSVMNLFCQIVQRVTQEFLSREVQKNKDGTIAAVEAVRLERKVNSQIAKVLLGPNNRLASAASWSMSRSDDLSVPGNPVTGEAELNALGYLEKFNTKARLVSSVEV